ncbi:hypothetical protein ACWDBO_51920 [Streptomyces mirabilis]
MTIAAEPAMNTSAELLLPVSARLEPVADGVPEGRAGFVGGGTTVLPVDGVPEGRAGFVGGGTTVLPVDGVEVGDVGVPEDVTEVR